MAGRRANLEGSIYQRNQDGLWCGVIVTGYSSTGRMVRKTVTAKTRAEVVTKLKTLQRQIDDGLPAPDTRMTVKTLLERWHDDVLSIQVQPLAASNYNTIYTRHIVPSLGRKTVTHLTAAHIDALISAKVQEGLSVSTVRRIRHVLSQALDQGVRWGVVTRNVAKLTKGPKAQRVEGRTLTPKQARTLCKALLTEDHGALYLTMLQTGIRRGEALGLKWTDVDLVKATLTIRRQLQRNSAGVLVTIDTKTAKSRRTVNLSPGVVGALKTLKASQAADKRAAGPAWDDSGFVFTRALGMPLDPRNVGKEFATITEGAGLGHWTPHELRHSAASLMLGQGIPLQVVAEVLGHSSIKLTSDVYGHILAPDRKKAAQAMAKVLDG